MLRITISNVLKEHDTLKKNNVLFFSVFYFLIYLFFFCQFSKEVTFLIFPFFFIVSDFFFSSDTLFGTNTEIVELTTAQMDNSSQSNSQSGCMLRNPQDVISVGQWNVNWSPAFINFIIVPRLMSSASLQSLDVTGISWGPSQFHPRAVSFDSGAVQNKPTASTTLLFDTVALTLIQFPAVGSFANWPHSGGGGVSTLESFGYRIRSSQ